MRYEGKRRDFTRRHDNRGINKSTIEHVIPSAQDRRQRPGLLALAVVVLLIGTTMPGALKGSIEGELWHGWPWSAFAHFTLFALIAATPAYGEDRWWPFRAAALALALAFITEFLQQFVPGRHPLLRDGLIDLAGTLTGLMIAVARRR